MSKSISISNEASFQLQFGVILKQIGQLYEFDEKDRFYIQLEDVQTIDVTQKSKHGRARCDIMLSLKNGKDEFSVAIELKYFKKAEGETITDNRFRILCDIENLENYKKEMPNYVVSRFYIQIIQIMQIRIASPTLK